METPFIARRWAEGQGDPLPLSDQLKIWETLWGKGCLGRKIFLTPQAATKFFLPTPFRFIGARYRDEVSRFAEGDAQRLDLDA